MNIFLVILIASTLGAMFLWSIHIDRHRAEKKLHKEEELVSSSCLKWVNDNSRDRR